MVVYDLRHVAKVTFPLAWEMKVLFPPAALKPALGGFSAFVAWLHYCAPHVSCCLICFLSHPTT
jgi:hypothetical protein